MLKKCFSLCLIYFAALLFFNHTLVEAKNADSDYLLLPYNRAGVIQKDWSINDVVNFYGEEVLSDGKVVIYGANPIEIYPMTTIKSGSDEGITIIWTDNSKNKIGWLEIYLLSNDLPSKWKLQDGCYVGMTLNEMENIAGQSIAFFGFYNGVAGFVPFSDYGGLYPKTAGVQLRIGFTDTVVGKKLRGDTLRWSYSAEVSPYKDKLILACIGIGMNRDPQLIRD